MKNKLRNLRTQSLLAFPACLLFSAAAFPAAEAPALTDYSLEQLMEVSVEVTSAARKPQKLEDTAAAIYVISAEDIRRSGMTSIPELLRMVPGMQVAQIDGSTWAISSRGFNGKNSDNLLVLLDGRILYSPTFSGVYWDSHDVVLADIERIEVVRGPGGTLWGANAVTGVINIISKPAAATQGGLASLSGGTLDRQGTARYGGKLGETGHFRVYAKRMLQDDFKLASGARAHDRQDLGTAGFRADWALAGGNSLTVQGDAYSGGSDRSGSVLSFSPPGNVPIGYTTDIKGANLLMRWKQALSATSEWALQLYFDTYERRYFNLGERRRTHDLDFQHRFLWGGDHDIVWGLGYRQTSDQMDNTFVVSYLPSSRTDSTASAFFQDEVALSRDKLFLTVGSKFEHNNYTGFEYQPNLRLRWKIDERHTAWAAVSRAVHTPSRTDEDSRITTTLFPGTGGRVNAMQLIGNPEIQSEKLIAYEMGYRIRPTERLSMDVALFRNEHRDLMTFEPQASYIVAGTPTLLVMPIQQQNRASGTSHGLGWSGNWQPSEKWRLKAAYSWLRMNVQRDADSRDTSLKNTAGESPQHQFSLQAFYALNAQTGLSAMLFYVDELPALNIPAYTRLDLRWGWRPSRDLELSLAARNLLDPRHPEFFNAGGPKNSEVPRSILGTVTWRF